MVVHETVPEHAYDRRIPIEEWKQIFKTHLRIGRENAKSCHEICVELGFKDGKRSYWSSMRTTSKKLLEEGFPVLSKKGKPSGYYIARNNDEILDFIEDQRNLIKGCERTISHAENILDK